ncbi:MAG: chemotaxis protein CheD [Sedimentisphaerales bacterium]|nr:chemotaxis protein CheD [Sedimentisphaerales bacterium]
MEKYINVATGEVKVCEGAGVLKSIAIGSCVVIAACDSKKHLGVMAHVMLPGRAPSNIYNESTRYAVDAIDKMVEVVSLRGFSLCDFEVCLVGAANVLKKQDDTICKNNIESITRLLKEKNISVKAAVLGGFERKGISVNIGTGSFYYTEGDSKRKLLWKSA